MKRTTLAAVLAGLAAKGVVAIQPQSAGYAVSLLNSSLILLPEEASVVKTLFQTLSTVQPYADSNTAVIGEPSPQTSGKQAIHNASLPPAVVTMRGNGAVSEKSVASSSGAAVGRSPSPENQVVIDPLAASAIKGHIDAVQDTFRKNLQGIYFRQNFRYAGIGVLATFAWGLFTAATLEASSSMFITFWLLMFTSIAGLVIGGVWTSKPARPSAKQRVARVLVPVLFFGLPGAVIYFAALPQSHGFVLALLLSVLLDGVFFVISALPHREGSSFCSNLPASANFCCGWSRTRWTASILRSSAQN